MCMCSFPPDTQRTSSHIKITNLYFLLCYYIFSLARSAPPSVFIPLQVEYIYRRAHAENATRRLSRILLGAALKCALVSRQLAQRVNSGYCISV